MRRQYLRIRPTSATLDPSVIHTSLASLHKLSKSESGVIGRQLVPFLSESPITFGFVALSAGEGKPVEFYYGVSARIEVRQQRLRTVYPESFDIDLVGTDLVEDLLFEVPYASIGQSRQLDQDHDVVSGVPDSQSQRGNAIEADGGGIHTEPSIDEINPYGVRWRGSVERWKDWMTPLQEYSDSIGYANTDEEIIERAREAENGDRFDTLWHGQTGGYESHSEADMALCLHLAYWTGGTKSEWTDSSGGRD